MMPPTPAIEVLLVEDSRTQARGFRMMLEEAEGPYGNYVVDHVTTCGEALDRTLVRRYDVVLCDLTLPDAEGLEAVEKLIPAAPDTPIVVLTSLADEALAIEAVHAGAEDYLAKKEIGPAVLVRAIRHAIERHRLTVDFNRFFTLAADLFGICARDGRLHRLNPAWERTLGYSVAQLLETPVYGVVHAADQDRFEAALAEAGEAEPTRCETRCTRADGRDVWLEWSLLGVPGRDVLFVTARDITERKQLEAAKEEMVSVVSHELRNPLGAIRGALEVVLDDMPVSDDVARVLGIASSNAERMLRICNDLLDLSKLDAHGLPLEVQPCEADEIVRLTAESAALVAGRAGVELRLRPVRQRFQADPYRVVQALTNLVGNALKFSPEGSVVTIGAEVLGQGHVTFRVSDQGRGIPPDKLETIFERFAQVEVEDSQGKKGTGLGLAITKGIVEQHGGHVWAESVAGRGSTFYVELPLS